MPGSEKHMNQNIRRITDGAMMIAIIGAVLLADRQLAGSISSMALFLFPLPMVFYTAKYGLKNSGAVLAAMLVLVFILGTPQSMFFVGCESVIGTIYGAGVHNKTESRCILLRTLVLAGLVELLAMVVFASFFGYDITAEIGEYQNILNMITKDTGAVLPETFLSENSLRTLFVISAVMTGVLEGFITHMMARLMLKRMRFPLPPSTPLDQYYPPKWSGYAALAMMMAYYYSMAKPFASGAVNTALQAMGTAGMMYLVVYGFISILILAPRMFPRAARWIALISILLVFMASLVLAVSGFLYITTDIHERICKGGNYASEA